MARVVVLHGGYGCDTGCCGHWVEIDGERVGGFEFAHPASRKPEDIREFVRDLVEQEAGAEHCADIDWENCIVVDD
jgi:hypothetical protein